MAQGEGFKHIMVTAADEDEEVIFAGAVDEAAPMAADVVEPPAAEAVEPAVPDAADALSAQAAEPSAAQIPAEHVAAATVPASESSVQSKKKRDAYRETTLEDLEREPMPFAQRVVIIAAVVIIVLALVYYFTVLA